MYVREKVKKKIQYILLLLLMVLCLPMQAQERLTGYAIDDQTGDSLGFVTVQYKGQQITTMCDHRGYFSIPKHIGKKLTFSAVGYKTRTVSINENSHRLLVSLKPDNRMLGEVTVKAKRGRYSRKNNPAVELMKKVIANKKKTDLSLRDYYQYKKYQKLTLALNDMKPDMLTNPKLSKYSWLIDQVEKCQMTGKLILPASVDETVTQHVYRRSPKDEKDIIIGKRSVGITDFFETGEIVSTVSKDVFTDVNIYDEQVRILQHPFTSPIADGAISFYRYYIEDTLAVGGYPCIHLHFLPNNQQDFGFRGDLYVLADSTHQVKRCELILPNQTDVNFVEDLRILQEFQQLPTGEWVLSVDDMVVELVLFDFLQKGVAIRKTRLSDYSFDEIPKKLFKGRAKTVINPDAELVDDHFWQQERKTELTASEAKMGDFLNGIQGMGGFKYILLGLKLLTENFIETSKDSKVDIGPVTSMISTNFIDGLRTRFGIQTTANLIPRVFWKGYIARGWKSHETYYSSTLTWALNKKKYQPEEFPKRNLSFLSTYDVMAPSDKFMTGDKDNLFNAFRWTKADKMMFYNRQQLTFEYEQMYGLRTLLSIKAEKNEAAGNMTFTPLSTLNSSTSALDALPSVPIRTTELRLELEYSPNALYSNTKIKRIKVNREAPIFTLSHSLGVKGLMGGDYHYNYTEASIFKRLWLSSWGRIDLYTRAGIQWNQVPFPLLCMPVANLSIFSRKQMFNMITNMEFLNDRFWSVDLNWDMQGKILNRIPLVKKARLREYFGVKMLWGGLSDKNNPFLPENAGSNVLMLFPDESYVMNPRKPYWEISAGVRGILRFFQIEYVRRMNYNPPTHGSKNSIRLGFTMMF